MTFVLIAGLVFMAACDDKCSSANALHTTVHVHVPHAGLVPRHCASAHDDSCREADHVSGLTHTFEFEQLAEGRLWCSYAEPGGVFRTRSCNAAELAIPQPSRPVDPSERREFHRVVEGCDLAGLNPPQAGDACGVLTQLRGLPVDSCAELPREAPSWSNLGGLDQNWEDDSSLVPTEAQHLFCRSSDSTCQPLPDGCASDAECNVVAVCDETRLCVRFACDPESSQCVWPDECLDTSDCRRSHSRCHPRTGRCDTFTCETGRCVGAAPR